MIMTEDCKDDESFVELFKKEHNEQFYVLIKMHLSFLLHMTTEESECFYERVKLRKWNLVPFGKKSKSKHLQDGAILSQNVLNQVHQIINYLKAEKNLKAEGIFRRTGSLERQNELKNLLSQGCTIDFEKNMFTVHDCASVLKGFLADLPEPITTDIQFPIFCQIAESFRLEDPSHENKIHQSIQLLFLLLPKENKKLLQDLLELLYLVTLNESYNRMSSENLAKLFTPHLLCPRKLAPECLLKESQLLFGIVAYMISKLPVIFRIPAQLMLDFKAHHEQGGVLNESVKGAAHTVFTFVDNKLTAKENEENVTDAALAELYAHIQSLPESSKKRKLVKQFNKQNGQGTPLQVIRSSVPKSSKTLGDSIKKHMFHKKLLKSVKMSSFSQMKSSSSEEVLNTPDLHQKTPTRGRLFCHNFDSSDDDDLPLKRRKSSENTPMERPRSKSDSDLSLGNTTGLPGQYLTSTPACLLNRVDNVFTPDDQDRKSMSPITRSAQRMPRAMQETMMTPRSRKPVLLVSGTNINNLAKLSPTLTHLQEEEPSSYLSHAPNIEHHRLNFDESNCTATRLKCNVATRKTTLFAKSKSDGDISNETEKVPKLNKTDSPQCLSTTFKDYLNSRDMLIADSPSGDSNFCSISDDFKSYNEQTSFIRDKPNQPEEQRMTESMLYILDGNNPGEDSLNNSGSEKKFVLKPRQFDENGRPIVFETSF
ncbi:rho GTPase-activating protein 19 isoform X1 [Anthonomus grandis grandis]|uniref:rho GTPase-activating protein 19 isoform X1 n=1 Tax=Anthonomus grandis grandis TaxID=2921223 RepID=UPI0021663D00|nr:rho GTPase-activating protein 19 isoform X1 [Anthonomus grandis grandis]